MRALLTGNAHFFCFPCARFFFPVRALLLGHARDFFRPMRTFLFSVRAIYFPNCGWAHIAVRAIWLFSGEGAFFTKIIFPKGFWIIRKTDGVLYRGSELFCCVIPL